MILILKGTYCLYDVNTSANSSFVCCSCVGVRTSWCETLPIYGTSSNGCSYSDAVRILLNPNKDRVCTKLPIYIEQNCSFVVDLKSLQDPDDLKSDDCGHWIHNGRKSTSVAVWLASGKVVCVKATTKSTALDENSKVFTLLRSYYSHDPHEDFKTTLYHLFGEFSCHCYPKVVDCAPTEESNSKVQTRQNPWHVLRFFPSLDN